ncbi:MAG: hypothetical protein KKA73_11980 [Chloroflexi bacterium]|nr:hypothetical protein [Chloroflexota bacterium]
MGSTSLTTDEDGGDAVQQWYYPYGGQRHATGSLPTDYRFTGQRFESMIGGLYDYGARFYDPLLGRFVSADTVVPGAGNPQALNRYSYVLNNPLKYTDPTGNWQQTMFDDFYMESLYSKARGYQLKGQHEYTGEYKCDISSPDVAVKLAEGSSNVLILAHGTGRESGWYESLDGYTLSNIANEGIAADQAVFNLDYRRKGGADEVMYMDSAYVGSELLAGMVTALGAQTDARIFVAGHSKGAAVVNRVQHGAANQYITAGAALAVPFFENAQYGSVPSNQLRVNPESDLATNPTTPGSGPGFWDKDKSRKSGHESVLSVDYARYVIAPYFQRWIP